MKEENQKIKVAIQSFEDIQAWQKAKDLSLTIYMLFRENNDFRFRDQIQSASVSIMNNIAEGFERKSGKELARFFSIAKGSCGEVRSMLYLALELKYVNKTEFDELYKTSVEISRMLAGFMKKITSPNL